MCGFTGFLRFETDGTTSLPERMRRAANLLRHRGPDQADEFLDREARAGMAFARLSIIDLSQNASQPMTNEDGNLILTFNGEIYNYLDLRSKLERRGHRLRSHADSEVLLHLYEDHGENMLERIDGMFAFVIYDRSSGRLFAARDRFGKKPLYYARTLSGFYWASEFRALAVLVPEDLNEDLQAFYHYVTFNCFPCEYSFFREIRKLLPGHSLTMEFGWPSPQIRRYYRLGIKQSRDSQRERDQRLRSLFAAAVKKRLMSDVPIGFYLSGGIDSSSMVVQASRFHSPVLTFSIALEEDPPEVDETPYARQVADYCGAIRHEVRISDQEFLDSILEVGWALDEPVVLPDAALLHILTKVAAEEGVKVLMSGDGADEVFFGYTLYWPYIEKYYRDLPIYRLIPGPLRAVPKALLRLVAPARFERVHRWLRGPYRFLGGNIGLSDVEKNRCLADRVLRNGSVRDWSDEFSIRLQREQPDARGAHLSKQLMLNEFNIRLPDLLLTRIDRVTMASSVEARNPYLDRELVEYATTIPFEDLFDGRLGKVAVRRALKDLLPEAILKRGKMGFGGSLEGRTKPLVAALHQEVMAESGFLSDYYKPTYLSWLATDQARDTYDGFHASWNVVMFALWKRKLDELMRTRSQTSAHLARG